jgi:hypothetical protein
MDGGTLQRMLRRGGGALLAVGLVACTAPTPYQPATDGFGYAEQQLEDNRYRVTFAGNADTDRETVQNYLLFRAAEVTLESGNDYFTMAERNLDRSTRYFGTVDPLYPGGYRYRRDPFAYGGFGSGTYTAHEINSYAASADIVVFSGEKSPENVNAYDARSVIERLRPVVTATPS